MGLMDRFTRKLEEAGDRRALEEVAAAEQLSDWFETRLTDSLLPDGPSETQLVDELVARVQANRISSKVVALMGGRHIDTPRGQRLKMQAMRRI